MSIRRTASAAVSSCLVLFFAACAAERLESRDPARGPAAAASPTTPVVRPTALHATEKQLASAEPATQHHDAEASVYVCPMHPEVQSPRPADCPKCGMHLVRKEPSP